MTSKDNRLEKAAELRRRAEEIAREKTARSPENIKAMSPEETRQTLHELRVHQIELEMQNEHLRQAQVELDASRERYFALYDLAPLGYCILSDQGLILEANLTVATLLGVDKDALVKQPITRFILKEDQDIYYLHCKHLFESGKPHASELRMVKKDGTAFWTHLAATVAQNPEGGPVCRVVLSDITDRKRSEEQIVHLASFPELNPHPVSEFAADGSVIYTNAVTRHLFPDIEALGAQHPFLIEWEVVVSQLKNKPVDHMAREVRVGERYYLQTVQYIEAQNSFRVYALDITERKWAEAENRRLRDKAEISSRLAAVGEMAAGIAHEINNPLTSVIGYSELLLEQNLPPDVKEQLQIIADGSQRVKDIVRHMLTFARQTRLVKTSANINDLIDNTLGIRSYVLRTANIEVIRDFNLDLPLMTADPGQLQQVFLNLIVNAEFAMKKAHDKGNLTITTEQNDGHIRISFRDDGPGMSPEIIKKVFNPFFTTKDLGEGTGLGLSLSRSIILEHNGTIEVESKLGQGANFIITLPIAPALEEAISDTTDNTASPPEKVRVARILVVDDEYAIRTLVSKILTTSGHTVDTIGDPDVVLLKLENTSYDVVIMDIRMPGMSGMELYTKITKQHPELAKKIIFITGDTSDLNIRDYLKHHVPYITKPFDRKTLLKQVNRLL